MRFKKYFKKTRKPRKTKKRGKKSSRLTRMILKIMNKGQEKIQTINQYQLIAGNAAQMNYWRPIDPQLSPGALQKKVMVDQTAVPFGSLVTANFDQNFTANSILTGTKIKRIKTALNITMSPYLAYWTSISSVPQPVLVDTQITAGGALFNIPEVISSQIGKCLVRIAILKCARERQESEMWQYLNGFQQAAITAYQNGPIMTPYDTRMVKVMYQKRFILSLTDSTKYKLNIKFPKKYAYKNLNFPSNNVGTPTSTRTSRGWEYIHIMYTPLQSYTWTPPTPDQIFVTVPNFVITVNQRWVDQ